jgi:hypothetical protein
MCRSVSDEPHRITRGETVGRTLMKSCSSLRDVCIGPPAGVLGGSSLGLQPVFSASLDTPSASTDDRNRTFHEPFKNGSIHV